MTEKKEFPQAQPSAAVHAEAAAWVARLHGPNRTSAVEASFRRWIADDPRHAAAVEAVTDTWDRAARIGWRPVSRATRWPLVGFRLSFPRAVLAVAAVAALAIVGTLLYLHSDAVATGIGEQRTLALEDGTRLYINTDSRVVVRFDAHARRVDLQKGEALFVVAKRPNWPFIVTAGDRQIRALGTAFVVRRDERRLAVTLMEGKVTVSPTDVAAPSPDRVPAASAPTTLSPGQRLTFASSRAPVLDRPPIDSVTAWQRGQVVLDNTTLADAVKEMNRYSVVQLVIEDAEVAHIPVSGVFRAGDSEDFARAVSLAYRLGVVQGPAEIRLAGGRHTASPTSQSQEVASGH